MASNDKLETFLEKLEEGWSWEQLEAELRNESHDLQAQLHAVRLLERGEAPILTANTKQAHRQMMYAAISEEFATPRTTWWEQLLGYFAANRRRSAAFAGLAMAAAALLCVLTMSIGGLFDTNPAISVDNVAGTVEIAALNQASWTELDATEAIAAGQVIRTGSDGHAVLTLIDGSSLTLESDSTLAIDSLETDGDKLTQIEMTQLKGSSRHDVIPTGGPEDHYLLTTPAGRINVRGTRFSVNVAAAGATQVIVDSGIVEMSGQGNVVSVELGQATFATVADGPSIASTAFSGSGTVESMDGENWVIAGLEAIVPATAIGQSDIRLGELVEVSGRLLSNDMWQVDAIKSVSLTSDEFSLVARLTAIEDSEITIASHKLSLPETALIRGDTELGQYVNVVVTVADGVPNATAVTAIQTGPDLLITITPSVMASATFTATATATSTESPMPTPDADGKVYICHMPPGNPDNMITLHVGASSLQAHLGHGDTVGPCEEMEPTATISATVTITATATISATPSVTPTIPVLPSNTPAPEAQVTICHVPDGNPDNAQTITVGESAVQAHLDHGDYLGPCTESGGNNGGGNNGGGNNGGGNSGGGNSGGNSGGGNSGGGNSGGP